MFTFTLQLIAFKDGNNSKCGLKNCTQRNLTVTDGLGKFHVFWKLFISVEIKKMKVLLRSN